MGQPSGWPAPVTGRANLVQSATQELTVLRGGYTTFTGDTAMNKSVQHPAIVRPENHTTTYTTQRPVKPRLKAVFKLVEYSHSTETRHTIEKHLVFSEALALLICYPYARIKFDRMEGLQ